MKSKSTIVLLLLSCFSLVAQQKISVEEIYTGAFRAQAMDELIAMKNTNQYTVLNFDRS
jgi:dipeptidyl-peptidase-4